MLHSTAYVRSYVVDQRALQYNHYNEWDRVFDKTTVQPHVGLRMPYNDKGNKSNNMLRDA